MSAAEGTGEQGSAEVLPDKPDALVEEINRTREELGNTVEALAAKVDVKARAQQKAAEVSGQLKSKLQDATQGLSGKAGQLRGEVGDRAAGATAPSAAARSDRDPGRGHGPVRRDPGRGHSPVRRDPGRGHSPVRRDPGRAHRLGGHPGAGPAAGPEGRGHRE